MSLKTNLSQTPRASVFDQNSHYVYWYKYIHFYEILRPAWIEDYFAIIPCSCFLFFKSHFSTHLVLIILTSDSLLATYWHRVTYRCTNSPSSGQRGVLQICFIGIVLRKPACYQEIYQNKKIKEKSLVPSSLEAFFFLIFWLCLWHVEALRWGIKYTVPQENPPTAF